MTGPVQARIRTIPARPLLSPTAIVCGSYLLALASAELLLLTSGLAAGSAAHAILVAVLLMHVIAAPRAPYRPMLTALLLPSLMRLLGLTIPVAATPQAIRYLMAGTPALLGAILAARVVALPRSLFDRPSNIWLQGLIAVSGVANGLLAYLVLRPAAQPGGLLLTILTAFVVAVFVAGGEELVFRGVLQAAASEVFDSPVAGLAVSTATFTLMYVGSLSIVFIILMSAMGLFLGWTVHQTRSLWGAIGAHVGMVVGLIVVWPLVLT